MYKGSHSCIHIPNWIFDSYSSPKCVKHHHWEFLGIWLYISKLEIRITYSFNYYYSILHLFFVIL